jgi:hypothetical protein
MSIEVPLYQQEKANTCALACLRMVLAAFGTNVEEQELINQAVMEADGTSIEEIERLARQYGLGAEIQQTSVENLHRIIAEGKLPIAYIDRAIFDLTARQRVRHSLRDAIIHVVVPVRVAGASATFHDPLPPRVTRKSVHVFEQAHGKLGSYSVVCSSGTQ